MNGNNFVSLNSYKKRAKTKYVQTKENETNSLYMLI